MSILHIIGIVVVGIVALFLFDRFITMRLKSTEALLTIVRGSDWRYYRNALLELQRRRVDVKQEVMPTLHLLISGSRFEREAGWMILKKVYPDLAGRVPDYNPKDSDDICKEKMRKILLPVA